MNIRKHLLLALTLSLPGIALAHTGTDGGAHHLTGLVAGVVHPFTGLDHLSAMIAVGIWSAMTARRIWVAPISFAGLLLVGAVAGMAGATLPAVEPMIAASLLVLGLLTAMRVKMPTAMAASLVGMFAVFHGLAHGAELGTTGQATATLAGMVFSTLLLHCVGLVAGRMLMRTHAWWSCVLGGGVALLGTSLLVGSM